MSSTKKALIEAVKFPLRLLVLAVLPFLAGHFTNLGVEWATILAGMIIFTDKVLHELWKEKKVDLKGLSPF